VGAREGGSVNHSACSASFLEASLASEIGSKGVGAVFDSSRVTHGLATEDQLLQDEIGGFRLAGRKVYREVRR
jgi:hypothetical protein